MEPTQEKKLLIVEDDKFLAMAYKAKFTKAGFTVEMAGDGEEALTKLQTFSPSIILLDLILPKKDGFATLADIKANAAWKDIPVIVSSNLSQKEDVDKVKALGAVDMYTKADISLESLVEKVNGYLSQGSLEAL